MNSAVALAILALMTVSPGQYSRVVTSQALPPVHWAMQRAEWIDSAHRASKVPHAVLVALVTHESGWRSHAKSPVGAEGLMQLMAPLPAWRQWVLDCARDSYACDQKNIEAGAVALALYKRRCGSMLGSLHAYRIGHCGVPGPRAHATMQLARTVAWRIKHPSARPIRVPRL